MTDSGSEKSNNKIKEPSSEKREMEVVKGIILSSVDSTPISGAFVIVPGTTIGSMSDPEGNFMIQVPEKTGKLALSAQGFESVNVDIDTGYQGRVYLKKITGQ